MLTNNKTLGTIDVPKRYSKRWRIENFFKELRNQWNIRNFPGTSLDAVRSHIALLLFEDESSDEIAEEHYREIFIKCADLRGGCPLIFMISRNIAQCPFLFANIGLHWKSILCII
ncbi:MAG: transposase [Methanophagales archaeon]|nr:transposase [Methanophagales archaeon]